MITIHMEGGLIHEVYYRDAGPEHERSVLIIDKDYEGMDPEDLSALSDKFDEDGWPDEPAIVSLYRFDPEDATPLDDEEQYALDHYWD